MLKKITGYFALAQCIWIVLVVCIRTIFAKSQNDINRYVHKASLAILRKFKAHIKVKRANASYNDTNNRIIFMSNHQSLLDLPLILATIPGTIRIVAKKELFKIPVFGKALQKSQCISVDREHPQAMENFFQIVQKTLDAGIKLWIFPEGTRSVSGELLPYKAGVIRLARELGATIVPVGIVGTKNSLPAYSSNISFNQSIELRMGEPIDSTHYSSAMMQNELTDKIQFAIAQLVK